MLVCSFKQTSQRITLKFTFFKNNRNLLYYNCIVKCFCNKLTKTMITHSIIIGTTGKIVLQILF